MLTCPVQPHARERLGTGARHDPVRIARRNGDAPAVKGGCDAMCDDRSNGISNDERDRDREASLCPGVCRRVHDERHDAEEGKRDSSDSDDDWTGRCTSET